MTDTGIESRRGLAALLSAALAAVVAVALQPSGAGWEWASPLAELQWYATDLGDAATLVQLVGNLGLLAVPAALGVLLWPPLGRPTRLVPAAVAVAGGIEVLQWLLPVGRVVSPVDAVLNAAGAVAAGLVVAAAARRRPVSTG